MKRSATGRVFATIFLGLMAGLYLHFNQMRWLARGREAFMGYQGNRFDRWASYHSAATMLIAGVILAVLAVGLYEFLAVGFTKVLPAVQVEE